MRCIHWSRRTDEVAMPLSIVFEKLWQSSQVPVTGALIFKYGIKEDWGSYWVVSLTSVPSTIMEQMLRKLFCLTILGQSHLLPEISVLEAKPLHSGWLQADVYTA